MSEAPNFRLGVRAEGDEVEVPTTLREFLADNEGAEEVCARVSALGPGEHVELGGGAAPVFFVRRFARNAPPRFTRVRVPLKFDGSEYATVSIDRKRLTLSIRPARKRMVIELELADFAAKLLDRQAKLNAREKRLARRSRR